MTAPPRWDSRAEAVCLFEEEGAEGVLAGCLLPHWQPYLRAWGVDDPAPTLMVSLAHTAPGRTDRADWLMTLWLADYAARTGIDCVYAEAPGLHAGSDDTDGRLLGHLRDLGWYVLGSGRTPESARVARIRLPATPTRGLTALIHRTVPSATRRARGGRPAMSTLTRHPAGLVPPAGRALPPRPPALRPATATPPPLKDPSDLAAWWDDMRERWEVRRGVALTSARACLIEVADAHDAARALAWLGRAHSLAGDHEDAERAGQQAHDEFVEHCARQWTARSLEMLGQSAAAAGRGDDAVSRFAQALDQYSGLSAVDAERVRRQLAAVQ